MWRLCAVLLLLNTPALSQQADPLIFREMIFDFGQVEESQDHVDHEFVFTNNSGRPLNILSVQASCGCTTPGWTKGAIQPGRTGFVKASFDPKGRPGYFNKSLTINTDLSSTPVILQIKGQVVNQTYASEFPVEDGSLHFQSRSINFNKVYINKDPVTLQFPFENAGPDAIKFLSVSKPAYFKVEMPGQVAPKSKGIIRITYDGKARNTFGFASDNIQFTTDDAGKEIKSFSVFASLEEYYALPYGEELLKPPAMVLKESTVDVGRYRPGITIERDVVLRNTGKRDLLIKAIQGNCSCITAEIERKTIRGGDSTTLRITFKPQNRGGTQQKAITVYSNDPRNPVQRINVLAFIED